MIRQFEIWLANLNPQIGKEPGKIRPVLVIQSNLLNKNFPSSTLICPVTSNLVLGEIKLLRVRIPKAIGGLEQDSEVLIDQIRAIDNKRLIEKIGMLPKDLSGTVKFNLSAVLDLG
jgi:mRNA interferase MazF